MARPSIGPAFTLRFAEELTDRVDAAAEAAGISRAEMIRQAVTEHLERTGPDQVREVERLAWSIAAHARHGDVSTEELGKILADLQAIADRIGVES